MSTIVGHIVLQQNAKKTVVENRRGMRGTCLKRKSLELYEDVWKYQRRDVTEYGSFVRGNAPVIYNHSDLPLPPPLTGKGGR